MTTQQLNRIELIGIIGNVRTRSVSGDDMVANFSVATNYAYYYNNNPIIETTWHNVVAFNSGKDIDFDAIVKGGKIHVIGRVKQELYVDINNEKRSSFEIVASTVEAVPQYECDEGLIAQFNK